jgi:hypothetical protein
MLTACVASLLLGQTIALHIETISDTSQSVATPLTKALAATIEEQTGRPVRIDDLVASPCTSSDRCIPQIRARLRAEELVLVRIFGAITLTGLVLHRVSSASFEPVQVAEFEVPQDRELWPPVLTRAVQALFPEPGWRQSPRGPAALIAQPEDKKGTSLSPAPWIALGLSAIAVAVGTGFGVDSLSAQAQIRHQFLDAHAHDALAAQIRREAIAADLLFGLAAVAGIAGITLFIFD